MSTNFKADGEQLDQDLEDLQQRVERVEQAIDGSGGSVGSGGGATPTTKWYDVTDYGAEGDGSAADTDEIQSAIDAAASDGGGTVYFPVGDYKITSALIGREGVSLLGAGRYQAVIHQEDPDEHGIDLKGADNLTIEGLGVTHDHGLAPQQDGQCLFSGGTLENVTVQECSFYESARQAVGFWDGNNRNIKFIHNDLWDTARAGVVIFGSSIRIDNNYFRGTGDDAIALNTDSTTYCSCCGNIIIGAATVGEQHGRSIKYHGRNTIIGWNNIFRSNQGGIRGQIVDHASGDGTDQPPTRNLVIGNLIDTIVDVNPDSAPSAAIELREFESAVLSNNSVYNAGPLDAFRIRNDGEFETYVKAHDNYVQNAARGFHFRHNTLNYVELFNNTFISVDDVVEFDTPVATCHVGANTGHDIERCMYFDGVSSGSYHIRFNWFTDVDSSNIVQGSFGGGEVNNYLNVPSGETSRVRNNADYDAVRWSDL